jgi:hypothetical protein
MFFLPAVEWDFMSPYGRFFFFFVLKRGFYFSAEKVFTLCDPEMDMLNPVYDDKI